jgi:hypothetical protein
VDVDQTPYQKYTLHLFEYVGHLWIIIEPNPPPVCPCPCACDLVHRPNLIRTSVLCVGPFVLPVLAAAAEVLTTGLSPPVSFLLCLFDLGFTLPICFC